MTKLALTSHQLLIVRQRRELAELVGLETRNKYEICDSHGLPLAFAAESGKGWLSLVFRNLFGHWRNFEIKFFNSDRTLVMTAHHPFRWIFREFNVRNEKGRVLGRLVSRWSLLRKKFDICSPDGLVLLQVSSPLWRPWAFSFVKDNIEAARISKRWSGIFNEALTDRDNFKIEFLDASLGDTERTLLLAASVYIDLLYFERKAN